ncbi:MAG: UDP-glucose 4-epimerase [Alteromonadaceae bacterium]|jgi:UDP-glucose 4-epimerase
MKILLTGATGFVGQYMLQKLIILQHCAIAVTRDVKKIKQQVETLYIENMDSKTNWENKLTNCEVVIHCAARVHMMNDSSKDPLEDFRETNTFGTLNLARSAAMAGVKRFIFLSSIKVSGEQTTFGENFKSSDIVNPIDPYAISKWEAEQGLQQISRETNMEIVIIRPPLVYGPGVKGNFKSMLKLSSLGIPLPFGALKHNLRSIVSVHNLIDLLVICLTHPNAKNKTFLVSDGKDISTAQMFQLLKISFEKPPLMLPIPIFIFQMMGFLFNKSEMIKRLTGNLQIDISETKTLLNWQPAVTTKDAFAETAKEYLQ